MLAVQALPKTLVSGDEESSISRISDATLTFGHPFNRLRQTLTAGDIGFSFNIPFDIVFLFEWEKLSKVLSAAGLLFKASLKLGISILFDIRITFIALLNRTFGARIVQLLRLHNQFPKHRIFRQIR